MSLTPDEEQKAKQLFAKYDKDNSGGIDKAEFTTLMSEMLEIDPQNTQKYIDFKFREADKDSSKAITYDEFTEFYAKIKKNLD